MGTDEDEDEPEMGTITFDTALDVLTRGTAGDGTMVAHDVGLMNVALFIAAATATLAEVEDLRRLEAREAKGEAKPRVGKLRRQARRALREKIAGIVRTGTLAAVGCVVYGDADTEQEGITAMEAVAPMVVELRALGDRAIAKLNKD